jgi:hypothetical protein
MAPEELEPNDGISRRRALKRIGAGATVAWSVPILTSIRTPAFAQYDNPCPDTGCPGENFEPCTGNPPGCQFGSCYERERGCFKIEDVEGNCHCAQNMSCDCAKYCERSSDCGPRQFCALTACIPEGLCLDCCGENCRDHPGRSRPIDATVKG